MPSNALGVKRSIRRCHCEKSPALRQSELCSIWEPLRRLPLQCFSEFLTPSCINWCERLFSMRSPSKSGCALQQLASYRIVQFTCPPRYPVGFCSSLSWVATALTVCLAYPARSYTPERASLFRFTGLGSLNVHSGV